MANALDEQLLREQIIYTALQMNRLGINQGTSGNLSVRSGEGMLISPSSVPYEIMKPNDIVYINIICVLIMTNKVM